MKWKWDWMKPQQSYETYSSYISWFQTFAVFWVLYAFFWVISRVWILYGKVSEHSVCSIFIDYKDGTHRVLRNVGHIKLRRRGITQKKAYNNVYIFLQPVREILENLSVVFLSGLRYETRTSKIWNIKCPTKVVKYCFNPLSPELNPICYLLALLAHDFLHVSRIRVKSLTLRLLMSYIHWRSQK
jgi:transposase